MTGRGKGRGRGQGFDFRPKVLFLEKFRSICPEVPQHDKRFPGEPTPDPGETLIPQHTKNIEKHAGKLNGSVLKESAEYARGNPNC